MATTENSFEIYFEWWLMELQKKGLVKKFEREPESLVVLEPSIIYSNVHYVKKDSILVKDQYGNKIRYSGKEESNPEGMYISIPYYKTTTRNSSYIITFTYKTHDYVQKVKSFVTIQGPALPKDIVLEHLW